MFVIIGPSGRPTLGAELFVLFWLGLVIYAGIRSRKRAALQPPDILFPGPEITGWPRLVRVIFSIALIVAWLSMAIVGTVLLYRALL